MRAGLLIVAGLVLVAFLVVAVVLPQMAGHEAKEAAKALIAGAEPARTQVTMTAEKAGSLSGAGKGVRLSAVNDSRYGELKWLVSESGEIRGWNEKNAIEIALTPAMPGSKVAWSCRGYPVNAMPVSCGGR